MLELNEILKDNTNYNNDHALHGQKVVKKEKKKARNGSISDKSKARAPPQAAFANHNNLASEWFQTTGKPTHRTQFTPPSLPHRVNNNNSDLEFQRDDDENFKRDDLCTFTLLQFRERREILIRKNLVLIVGVLLILSVYSIWTGQEQIQESKNSLYQFESLLESPDRTSSNKGNHHFIQAKRFMQMQERIRPISGYDSLLDATSPQFKALDWIGNHDSYQISPDDPLLIQRYALAVLYFATNGPEWKHTLKWLSAMHECEWKGEGGVRQCNEKGEVTDLSLWNELRGTIPSEIMQLKQLETLYLARNDLRGTIPSEIRNLKGLNYLGLQHNKLTGTLPKDAFEHMNSLKFLYLEKNDLTGTIRRSDYPCLLMKNNGDETGNTEENVKAMSIFEGDLEFFTSDCRSLISIKQPEITCACCTECYLA